MKSKDFGKKFSWGVATAAYQIEGAWNKDGKGESIWDRFSHKKGKVARNENGDVACDHYHRFQSDIKLLKSMGVQNYRFSTAWTRILPKGYGQVNQTGLDFYKRVIDTCLKNDIDPNITLYHWDLPQALEDKGGWTNRDTFNAFCEYTDVLTREFQSKVKRWFILNEPLVFTGAGYFAGAHAPGRRGIRNFLSAAHHATLAQGEGGRIAKANVKKGDIGTTFSCAWYTPASDRPRDVKAAQRFDAVFNRFFIEPALGLGYPLDSLGSSFKRIEKYFKSGDDARMKFDFDFIGIQNYTREVIKFSPIMPYIWLKPVPAKKRVKGTTDMGWEVYPEAIYNLLKQFAAYKNVKRLLVTENGCAFPDVLDAGQVRDKQRISFLKSYLAQVYRAKKEGVPVEGYYVWSFLDNFEWAEGYRPRFGLVYVDYETQRRYVKDSGHFFKDFLNGKAEIEKEFERMSGEGVIGLR